MICHDSKFISSCCIFARRITSPCPLTTTPQHCLVYPPRCLPEEHRGRIPRSPRPPINIRRAAPYLPSGKIAPLLQQGKNRGIHSTEPKSLPLQMASQLQSMKDGATLWQKWGWFMSGTREVTMGRGLTKVSAWRYFAAASLGWIRRRSALPPGHLTEPTTVSFWGCPSWTKVSRTTGRTWSRALNNSMANAQAVMKGSVDLLPRFWMGRTCNTTNLPSKV